MRVPETGEIESLRAELERRIADGAQARAELAKLEAWLATTQSLFPANGTPTTTRIITRETVRFSPFEPFAEAVLKRTEKLHLKELVKEMRKVGWLSTGDEKHDMKNAFSCLSSNKKFKNLGRNVWALAKEGGGSK